MEEKLDGERMQLHMRGNGAQWCYWSRKAKDYSELPMDEVDAVLTKQRICTVHMSEREV
jgi:ATP-dependent DNA ligase